MVTPRDIHLFCRSLLATGLLLPLASYAQDFDFEGGVTIVTLHSNDARIRDEVTGSVDLVATFPVRRGEWTAFLEGSTTPRDGAVSATLPEANADAGAALSRDEQGRLQLSELHYTHFLGRGRLTAGLLDATGFIDSSEVAGDETAQFLGTTLVNNPTIEFPDYALGVAYQREAGDGPGYTLLLMSSHGLADNPRASYSELMNINDPDKGAFVAGEAHWQGTAGALRLGAWGHLADHERLDGSDRTENNYGLYALADRPVGPGMVNVRLGWANPNVSKAARFVGVAYEQETGAWTFGAGLTRTAVSSKGRGPDEDDMTQAELYARFNLSDRFSVTPSVQWLRNSGFDRSSESFDREQRLLGLRLGYSF